MVGYIQATFRQLSGRHPREKRGAQPWSCFAFSRCFLIDLVVLSLHRAPVLRHIQLPPKNFSLYIYFHSTMPSAVPEFDQHLTDNVELTTA